MMQAHTKGGISTAFQFTTFTKNGGVLTKSITLGPMAGRCRTAACAP